MALSSQQIKDMQSWYGTKADGIWGSKSTTAAGGRDAGAAYSLYSSNKGRYSSYTDYMSYGGGRNDTQGSGTNYNNGSLTASQIKEMQDYYGVTADGMWGKNSTAAAGGLSAADAWTKYLEAMGKGGYSDYTPSSGTNYNNGSLTASQIKEMQDYYGVTADGMWGKNSTAAAGGLSAADAWTKYQGAIGQGGYDDYYGSGGTDYSGLMSYSEYLKRVGGDDYQAAVQKAIEAQVQAATDQYNSQIENAGKDYEENARRAYINKMMSQRNMDQELAANGVYGGMADSQRIASETNYENDLTGLTNQYQSTISDLQQAITSAKMAGDAQAAEAMANYLSQIQAQYASYLQNERSIQAEIDMFNRQLAAQQAQEARAASYSSGGNSGSGYDAEVAALQQELNARGANLTVDGIMGPKTQAAYDQIMGGNSNINNPNGKGWIALSGGGRFTYAEIQRMIDRGEVKKVVNDKDGTVSYLRVR